MRSPSLSVVLFSRERERVFLLASISLSSLRRLLLSLPRSMHLARIYIYIYIYIYTCICVRIYVCVCVCKGEKKREPVSRERAFVCAYAHAILTLAIRKSERERKRRLNPFTARWRPLALCFFARARSATTTKVCFYFTYTRPDNNGREWNL